MAQIYFTGDLHFGHENVLRFDGRPFSSVEEMDEELISRWNNKVGKGDIVYILGDMIWKSRTDDAATLLNRLNGQKILIKGNHDKFLHNAKAKKALAGIKDYDDIPVTLKDGTVRRCILSHYFKPFYNGHRYNAIHLHAHSHFTDEADYEISIVNQLNKVGFDLRIYNVGCMYWNFEPVTLDEILEHEPPVRPNANIIKEQVALTKEDFCRCISLIKEQEEIDEKVSKVLSLVGDGHFIYGANNKTQKALFFVLRKIFDDEADYIGWWLYEDVDKKVREKFNGKEIEYNLETPEALYDFLIHNKTSKTQIEVSRGMLGEKI